MVFQSVYIVAVVAIIAALALTFSPEEPAYIPFNEDQRLERPDTTEPIIIRFVDGDMKTMLTGKLYLPFSPSIAVSDSSTAGDGDGRSRRLPPVIVMAHGMGLIQDSGLTPFIKAFRSSDDKSHGGFAVFTFDYATFGASDGYPRHQVHPTKHVADLKAAIGLIQNGEKNDKEGEFDKTSNRYNFNLYVDTTRIGVWGTSLGGGHVLMVQQDLVQTEHRGNANSHIKAVISQVPHIASGLESIIGSLVTSPRHTSLGVALYIVNLIKWTILQAVFKKPSYMHLVGQPGTAALMQNVGDYEGYLSTLAPTNDKYLTSTHGWENAATSDSGLHMLIYRPLSALGPNRNGASENAYDNANGPPVLLFAAEHDTLCPAKYVQQARERIGSRAELHLIEDAGHFDVYRGEYLEAMLEKQVRFFKTHLLGKS